MASATPPPIRITHSKTNSRADRSVSRYLVLVISAVVALIALTIFAPRFSLLRSAVSAARHSSIASWRSPSSPSTLTTTTASTTAAFAGAPLGTVRPLSTMPSKEDREWNRLADHMDKFHSHFRYEFNRVYTLADGGFHKEGMTLPRFLREAQQLSHHLDMHHRIESYIFPILAKKMPQFKAGARESGEHLKKHKGIHDGLDRYDKFLADALANPSTYDATTLRAVLDGFREVLFTHLDEEVHDLGGPSMKAAGWTLDEIRRVPM